MTSLTKSQIFVWLSVCFAAGILLASVFNIPRPAVYVGLAACAAAGSLSFIARAKPGAFLALFLFCLFLGMLRLQLSFAPNQYADLFGNKQQLEGYIVEDPDVRPTGQMLTFRPNGFSQNILLTVRGGQQFFYGDWLAVSGTPKPAENYDDFDYEKYLERFNVYATAAYPKILMLRSNRLNPVKYQLLRVKAAFLSRLDKLLDEPQYSLAVGILIGGHGNLPKQVVSNFSETGVSHIIAVSGYNITIIVLALVSLASVIGRRRSVWLAALAIICFVVICGASSSVVRAAIMGSLLLLGVRIGRQYAIIPALFFAALLMLIQNPRILYWDAGFQLSFAATMGIVFFMPLWMKLTPDWDDFLGHKSLLFTTLSAIIATMPLIILDFGIVSVAAPIVNLLVVPAVPYAMLFGFLAVLPFVGPGCALVANWILLYILKITSTFAALPYSYLNAQIGPLVFWALVAAIFGLYFLLRLIVKNKQQI